jgi:predicted HTH domain antitoxin
MSQKHVTARVPDDLYEEIERVQDVEKTDMSTTVKRLLQEGVENWKISNAVERYRRGDVSMGRGAEIAGVPVWEFMEILEDRGVEVGYTEEDFEDDVSLVTNEE